MREWDRLDAADSGGGMAESGRREERFYDAFCAFAFRPQAVRR